MKPMDHGSDQTLSPAMHQELVDRYNAEIRRRNKEPTIPNPRFQLLHEPGTLPFPFPRMAIVYHADSPSAGLQIAHRIADKLELPFTWHDKFTGRTLVLSAIPTD